LTRLLTIDPPALGRRGEGWVVLQSIIIAAAAACAVVGPRWPHGGQPWLRIAGFVLEPAGVGMFILSRITLGRSFTPFPRPRDHSTLRSTGIYARARHPVYGGLLVAGLGLSLQRSPASDCRSSARRSFLRRPRYSQSSSGSSRSARRAGSPSATRTTPLTGERRRAASSPGSSDCCVVILQTAVEGRG